MPVIRRADLKADESRPDLIRRTMLSAELGAGHLEVVEVAIAPGKKIPLHIHPTHEEGIYILDGPLDYILGDESGAVETGDMILAPAGVKHETCNPGTESRRILGIFPTTNVQRVPL